MGPGSDQDELSTQLNEGENLSFININMFTSFSVMRQLS